MTERVWNEPWPTIRVSYRNLTQVYFRLVREDWAEPDRSRPATAAEWLDDDQRKALLAKKPDLAWSAELPATEDYQRADRGTAGAEGPQAGLLLPAGQPRPGLRRRRTTWSAHRRLGEQPGPGHAAATGDGRLDGFVLDAASGEPIEGADVQVWPGDWNGHCHRRRQGQDRPQRPLLASPAAASNSHAVLATLPGPAAGHGQRLLDLAEQLPAAARTSRRSSSPTARCTGRARRSSTRGSPSPSTRRPTTTRRSPAEQVTVVFSDVNGKEIARQKHRHERLRSASAAASPPRATG